METHYNSDLTSTPTRHRSMSPSTTTNSTPTGGSINIDSTSPSGSTKRRSSIVKSLPLPATTSSSSTSSSSSTTRYRRSSNTGHGSSSSSSSSGNKISPTVMVMGIGFTLIFLLFISLSIVFTIDPQDMANQAKVKNHPLKKLYDENKMAAGGAAGAAGRGAARVGNHKVDAGFMAESDREVKLSSEKRVMDSPTFLKAGSFHGYPMIIHQSWKNTNVPNKFRDWPDSWKVLNPGWQYYLWTDNANRAFIAEYFPWLLKTYDALPKPVMRADLSRYAYMYHYGGLYADLDMECVQPFHRLISQHRDSKVMLGRMSDDFDFPHNVPNAFMISHAKHPVWLWVIRLVMQRLNSGYPEWVTGPIVLKDAIEAYMKFGIAGPEREDGIVILDPEVIYPVDWHRPWFGQSNCSAGTLATFSPKLCKESLGITGEWGNKAFAITYWTHSWE